MHGNEKNVCQIWYKLVAEWLFYCIFRDYANFWALPVVEIIERFLINT